MKTKTQMLISAKADTFAEIKKRIPTGLSQSEFLQRCALGQQLPVTRSNAAARAYRDLILRAAMAHNCLPWLCEYVVTLQASDPLGALAICAELAAIDDAINDLFPQYYKCTPRDAHGQTLLVL